MDPVRFKDAIIETLDEATQKQIHHYFRTKDEDTANQIINTLNPEIHSTSKLRYRFHASKHDQVIGLIFDAAIKKAPYKVQAAVGNSHYPLWKRVVWIQTPSALSKILGNFFVKLLVSAAVIAFSISKGHAAYNTVNQLLTGRALTAIINNTSLKIIHLFNATIALIETAYNHRWEILGVALIIRLLPNIPYLTAFARTVSSYAWTVIWSSPQSIATFVSDIAFDIAVFGWNTCNDVSMFLRDTAEKSEAESLAHVKQQGRTLWAESLQKTLLASV